LDGDGTQQTGHLYDQVLHVTMKACLIHLVSPIMGNGQVNILMARHQGMDKDLRCNTERKQQQ